MNREQKRLLQRQGQLDANGNPTRRDSRDPSRRRERVTVRQFFTQVRAVSYTHLTLPTIYSV